MNQFISLEQNLTRQLYLMAPAGIGGQFIIALLVGWLFMNQIPREILLSWCAAQIFFLAYRCWLVRIYKRERISTTPDSDDRAWLRRYLLGVMANGVGWGVLPLMTLNYAPQNLILIELIVLLGMVAPGVVTLGASIACYLAYMLPIFAGAISWMLLQFHHDYYLLATMALIYMGFMIYAALSFNRTLRNVFSQSLELHEAELQAVTTLGRAGELRDNETGAHINRVSMSCRLLALEAGLDERFAETIQLASTLHDVGKIGVPDNILLKCGKLDDNEMAIMRSHVTLADNILGGNDSRIMRMGLTIARNHHEKWDGSGYPKGIAGKTIPVEGRIVAICDVFDALVSERPYKQAWPAEKALAFMREQSGLHFDPELVRHFLQIAPRILALQQEYPNEPESLRPAITLVANNA
jgi:hypothetical protein